jgi:hypothetical protein
VSEPPSKRVRRQRRPTLSAALKAAKAAGQTVKSAVLDPDGRVTLTFGSGESVASTNDDWDKKLEELEHRDGKH